MFQGSTTNPKNRTSASISFEGLKFDFNECTSEILSDNEFRKSQVNDAGEPILPQTSEFLICQFKKLMVRMLLTYYDNCKEFFYFKKLENGQKVFIYKNKLPFHIGKFLQHLILTNPHKLKEYCNLIVQGEIWWNETTGLPPRFETDHILSYCAIENVYKGLELKNEQKLYERLQNSNPDNEYLLYESILLKNDEILQVKNYISKNLSIKSDMSVRLNEMIEISKKAKSFIYSLREKLLEEIELHQDTQSFDPKSQALFMKLIEVEFPELVLNKVKAMLMLDQSQSVLLMIEYIKFLILKYFYPEDTYCSFMISKIWEQHFYMTYHYKSLIHNCFEGDIRALEQYSVSSKSDFEECYIQTIQNYATLFYKQPPEFIYRSYKEEVLLNTTQFYEVNLLRLVFYHHYEEIICPPMHDEDTQKGAHEDSIETSFLEKHCQRPFRFSEYSQYKNFFYKETRQLRKESIEEGLYHQFLWRKNYPTELFEDIKDTQNEPDIYAKGGLKFYNFSIGDTLDPIIKAKNSNTLKFYFNSYCPNIYLSRGEELFYKNVDLKEVYFKINLDDLADNACESIHMYTDFLNRNTCEFLGNEFLAEALD